MIKGSNCLLYKWADAAFWLYIADYSTNGCTPDLLVYIDANEDACGDAPCQNGGMCMNADTDASCDCPYSFTGEYCESGKIQ